MTNNNDITIINNNSNPSIDDLNNKSLKNKIKIKVLIW